MSMNTTNLLTDENLQSLTKLISLKTKYYDMFSLGDFRLSFMPKFDDVIVLGDARNMRMRSSHIGKFSK